MPQDTSALVTHTLMCLLGLKPALVGLQKAAQCVAFALEARWLALLVRPLSQLEAGGGA